MVIINMRPVGWGYMTPRQWATIRDMIRLVRDNALRSDDMLLVMRAQLLLSDTEDFDVQN